MIIFAAVNGFCDEFGVDTIRRFETKFFDFMDEKYPKIGETVANERIISDQIDQDLKKAITEFVESFKKELEAE